MQISISSNLNQRIDKALKQLPYKQSKQDFINTAIGCSNPMSLILSASSCILWASVFLSLFNTLMSATGISTNSIWLRRSCTRIEPHCIRLCKSCTTNSIGISTLLVFIPAENFFKTTVIASAFSISRARARLCRLGALHVFNMTTPSV